MSYEIQMKVLVKFLKNVSSYEALDIIKEALWGSKELRDVDIYEFEIDPEYSYEEALRVDVELRKKFMPETSEASSTSSERGDSPQEHTSHESSPS